MVLNQTPTESLWVLTLIYRANHLAHIDIAPGNTRIRIAALSGRGYGRQLDTRKQYYILLRLTLRFCNLYFNSNEHIIYIFLVSQFH